MKIIFLEEAANLGGARIATVDLAANLNKLPNVTSLIYDVAGTCEPFIDYCNSKNIKCNVIAPLKRPLIVSSTSVLKKVINALKLLLRIGKVNHKIRKIIKQEKPDYIIVNSYRRLIYLLGTNKSTEVCFMAHGWYLPQEISFFNRWLLRKVPTKIFCGSQATKHAIYANRLLPLKSLYVVRNFIEINDLPKEIAIIPNSDGCFKILHSAGFTKGKGQLVSVEIARILKERGFKFKLVFTGLIYAQSESKNYYYQVVELVNKYGLESDIEFIIGKNNVIDYFRACDVLIFPSQTEGFGLVVMEAMSVRKPVIANSVGGVTDLILDNFTGFLPSHDNAEEYANIIMRLSSDSNLYNRITENAYRLVSEAYSAKNQIDSIKKAFQL